MSYNPYLSSTPPRPFRILFGALMAIGGLVAGITGAVHEFHKALVLQGDPVEMDWDTLVSEGYGENPHIRLTRIKVIDPYLELDEVLGEHDLDQVMGDPILRSQMAMAAALGPAKVIPMGANESEVEPRVVIAEGVAHLDEAFRQIDESGSVTGMVSTYGLGQMIRDAIALCSGKEVDGPQQGDAICYTIVPVDGTPDLNLASNVFLMSGFALSLGLILCGSGGPGILCCCLAPIPALLSLVGYPMRYGRGGRSTRMMYLGIGIGLMALGYYLLVPKGNFGATDGNPIFHALGFVSLFVGLGGVLAVPMQITTRALGTSVSPSTKPKRKPVRMSWDQACSMEPMIREVEYDDQPLVRCPTLPLSGELKQHAEVLEAVGFNRAEPMQWQRETGITAAAIQLGCQRMVVTDLEYNNDADIVECHLVSLLGTGIPIITLSANSGVKQNRPTGASMVQRASTSDPSEMLGEHLEIVVSEAERRNTIVVEVDEHETKDVVQLTRRILAEIQGVIDGQVVNVGPKRYGRFHFPAAPIADLATKAV